MTAQYVDTAKNPIAFPTLSHEQLELIAGCGAATIRTYNDGEVLFSPGERDFPFYVVKSGEIAIMDRSGDVDRIIVVHRAGNFVGDVAYLTDAPSMVGAVAQG